MKKSIFTLFIACFLMPSGAFAKSYLEANMYLMVPSGAAYNFDGANGVGDLEFERGGGFSVAYGQYLSRELYADIEVSYNNVDVENALDAEYSSVAVMANAKWDVDIGKRFVPYGKVGVGLISNLSQGGLTDSVNPAYNFGIGSRYKSRYGADFVTSYEFLETFDDVKIANKVGANYESKFSSHNVKLGWRFNF